LGIDLGNDEVVLLDQAAQNLDLDYQYDYLKEMFSPINSDSANVTEIICQRRYKDGSDSYSANGHYVTDFITVSSNQQIFTCFKIGGQTFPKAVRFCDFDQERTGDAKYKDPLEWFMKLPIDGFLGLRPGGENIIEKVESSVNMKQLTLYINR
jgi:hypothetical protein